MQMCSGYIGGRKGGVGLSVLAPYHQCHNGLKYTKQFLEHFFFYNFRHSPDNKKHPNLSLITLLQNIKTHLSL